MLVTDYDQLAEVVAAYKEFDAFCFDCETKGPYPLDPKRNEVFWISLAGPGRADVIPMGHPLGDVLYWEKPLTKTGRISTAANAMPTRVYGPPPLQLWPEEVFGNLEPLFFSDRAKIGHNVRFDVCSIAKYYGGTLPEPPFISTDVAAHVLNENHTGFKPYSLESCCRRELGFTWEKSFGKAPATVPFRIAARYSFFDAKNTWLLWLQYKAQLEEEGLMDLFQLEIGVTEVVCHMEMAGAPIDVEAIKKVDESLADEIAETYNKVRQAAGWDINLNADAEVRKLVYEIRRHKPVMWTEKTNQPSTAAKALEDIAAKDEVVAAIIHWASLKKMHSTFVTGIRESLVNDRIHGSFNQRGARTGRFSCVSGATILQTSRGEFRFDEYRPVEGDLVQTHTGALQRVVRKIYKGRAEMFRVALSNGAAIECTQEHRLLTPAGWVAVRGLQPGSVVWSYGGIEELRGRSGECEACTEDLLRRGQADVEGDGAAGRDHIPQRAVHRESVADTGAGEGREGTAVLTLEDGRAEPDDRQEWLPTPQLQGADPRRARLSDEEGGRGLPAMASGGLLAGLEEAWVCFLRRSSHRRRQAQQFARQSGVGDTQWASGVTCQAVEVREITSLGAMGVWDIEVERDHSYLAQGFLNHNSDSPNMQNIPVRQTKVIRDMFIAPPGWKMIVCDYSQIELRLLAHYSQDPVLLKAYHEGINLHTLTAQKAFHVKEPTKLQYSYAKNTNFTLVFGGSPETIAERYTVPLKDAKAAHAAFYATYRRVDPWRKAVVLKTKKNRVSADYAEWSGKKVSPPYAETITGRRRRLPEIFWSDRKARSYAERQAVSMVIQGTAGDINKYALVNVLKLIKENGLRWQIILTVHDELVALVPETEAQDAAVRIKETMENLPLPVPLRVPLLVDVDICDRWSEKS